MTFSSWGDRQTDWLTLVCFMSFTVYTVRVCVLAEGRFSGVVLGDALRVRDAGMPGDAAHVHRYWAGNWQHRGLESAILAVGVSAFTPLHFQHSESNENVWKKKNGNKQFIQDVHPDKFPAWGLKPVNWFSEADNVLKQCLSTGGQNVFDKNKMLAHFPSSLVNKWLQLWH